MTLFTVLTDAVSKYTAQITEQRQLVTIQAPYPPLGEQKTIPFRQYFTDDGLIDGNEDMSVDGSSTNVDYFINASPVNDRYISRIDFIVGYGTSAEPFQWADGTALTNGIRIFYGNDQGEIDIHDGIKNTQDMFRLTESSIAANWEVRGVNALNDYGYFVSVNLGKFSPLGVKLDKGSKQRLTIRIRDNVTNADSFNCIGYGFDRFE